VIQLHPRCISAYSGRCGNMSFAYGDTSKSVHNRREFLQSQSIDYRDLVCAQQVHGDNVVVVRAQDKGKGALSHESAFAAADALVTDVRGLPLGICTADCLSVFFYDARTHTVGLAHSGWRSTKGNIAEKTIGVMQRAFEAAPEDILVGFGPSLRSCCYEVGEEFRVHFPGEVARAKEGFYFDLAAANKRQLVRSGVQEKNIIDCGICTSCRGGEFFSYRREGSFCGRMLSVTMVKEE
jgi:YfiH family protein